MTLKIKRTGNIITLLRLDRFSGNLAEGLGYQPFCNTNWQDISFNRLLMKDGKLYRIIKSRGKFPFDSLTIEEIGTIDITDGKTA